VNNSTSSTFRGLPFESDKQGETISMPSIRDYLEEISKEDNIDVDEYLASSESTKTIEIKSNLSMPLEVMLNPKMTYDWKDRLLSMWIQFKNIKYCGYKPFDFNIYPEYNNFFYTYKNSTPWKRFKFFIRSQFMELKWAWQYTPDHIIHYNKNKPRIGWFENKIKDLFFLEWDGKKNKTIRKLEENGYRVEDNRIWHEPIPKNEKRII
jgi:hypothetical protein